MKEQMVGIALILLGIIFALPIANGAGSYWWFIGAALGVIGTIIVIASSGQGETK